MSLTFGGKDILPNFVDELVFHLDKFMAKILRIINRFNLGGPTFNAALLTKHLTPDYETLLIGGKEEKSEKSSMHILDELGLKPQFIDSMQRDIGIKNDREAYKEIKKIIKSFKPDIIHTHASKAGAIGRYAGIAYGKSKLVHTFHGHVFHSYFGAFKTNVYKNIERALALKTDKIIAISQRQKLELVKKYGICSEDKVQVIPLGFDLDKFHCGRAEKRNSFRTKFGLDDDEIAIGIIGRLVPIKNHHLFIDAIKSLKVNSKRKIRAFIIGDGEEREALKTYTNQIGLDFLNGDFENGMKATVHFTSWIKEIDWANAGLDIIALSSLNEGTPVSLIEAQAAGTPIITTKVGGVRDIVQNNKTGIIVPANNPNLFIKKLQILVEDEQLRKKMSDNGWDFVKDKFHFNRLVKDMRDLYENLLHKA